MVKITGKTRDPGHLQAHLDYISRNGALGLEGLDGERLEGRAKVRELARAWSDELDLEPSRRKDAPLSRSVVLSMPQGTDPIRLKDAADAFAQDIFGNRFPYVFVLHDEGRHPHVHLTVRALGRNRERLNPRKADLQIWREQFAHRLRERGVEAEATPRRARANARKAERTSVRKMREKYLAGLGPLPAVLDAAYREAAGPVRPAPWLEMIRKRELAIRTSLVGAALALSKSEKPAERALGELIERHVRARPRPKTRDESLRKRLRDRTRERPPPTSDRDRET